MPWKQSEFQSPRLQPMIKSCHWEVNFDNSKAAGTLLIAWLARIRNHCNAAFQNGRQEMLESFYFRGVSDENKKRKKVPSKE